MSATDERQFVDTNVLVYAHDTSAGEKHTRASTLLQALWRPGSGCLRVQILQEFYVTITARVPTPLAPDTARERIAELVAWIVHRPTVDDVLDALAIARRYDVAFWDAMVTQSATQLGCARIWSEDLNAGQRYGSVRIENPFAPGGTAEVPAPSAS